MPLIGVLLSLVLAWPVPATARRGDPYIELDPLAVNLPAMSLPQGAWDLPRTELVQGSGTFISADRYAAGLASVSSIDPGEYLAQLADVGYVARHIVWFDTDLYNATLRDDLRVVNAVTVFRSDDGASAFLDLPMAFEGESTDIDPPALGDEARLVRVENDDETSIYPEEALVLQVRVGNLVVGITFDRPFGSEVTILTEDVIARQMELSLDRIDRERAHPTPNHARIILRPELYERLLPTSMTDLYIVIDDEIVNLEVGSFDDPGNLVMRSVAETDIRTEYDAMFYLRDDEGIALASLWIGLFEFDDEDAVDTWYRSLIDHNAWVTWYTGDAVELDGLPRGIRGFALPSKWIDGRRVETIFLEAHIDGRAVLFQIGDPDGVQLDVAVDLLERQIGCVEEGPRRLCGTFDAHDLFPNVPEE